MNIDKKFIYIICIFAIIGIFVYLYFTLSIPLSRTTVSYPLGGKRYTLLVARRPQDWAQGLMNYYKPTPVDGMLFVFPNKESRTFWNKNTFLDLDLYWVDGTRIVGKSFLPSIEKSGSITTVSSPKPVDRVIEIIR